MTVPLFDLDQVHAYMEMQLSLDLFTTFCLLSVTVHKCFFPPVVVQAFFNNYVWILSNGVMVVCNCHHILTCILKDWGSFGAPVKELTNHDNCILDFLYTYSYLYFLCIYVKVRLYNVITALWDTSTWRFPYSLLLSFVRVFVFCLGKKKSECWP